MAWAPKYGLKGIIDASLRVKMHSNHKEANEVIMPLEFKTGKATSGQASSLLMKFMLQKFKVGFSQNILSGSSLFFD